MAEPSTPRSEERQGESRRRVADRHLVFGVGGTIPGPAGAGLAMMLVGSDHDVVDKSVDSDNAAHAGCFTMALALGLTEAGHPPTRIDTTARVGIEKTADGFRIPRIELQTEADVPGIDGAAFEQLAQGAKAHCHQGPVVRAHLADVYEPDTWRGKGRRGWDSLLPQPGSKTPPGISRTF